MKIQQKKAEQSVANKKDGWRIDDQHVREARSMQYQSYASARPPKTLPVWTRGKHYVSPGVLQI